MGDGNETLVLVNRASMPRKIAIAGAARAWSEIERTGLEEVNAVSAVPGALVIQPGEIVVLSTIKAE
jgi:hypothetical protein